MSGKMKFLTADQTDKKRKNERARQLKIYSIGSVLILAVIILLFNLLFEKVLGNALTFDFTVERSNSISDESQKFIDSLPDGTKIRIVGLFEKPESVISTEYQYTSSFAVFPSQFQ